MDAPAKRYDLAIIGAGIIGLATAYRVLQRWPGLLLAVVEKEPAVALHQSGRNSGVLHSGIYYRPGSLKARLCLEGKAEMERFAEEHEVSLKRCGKLIIAARPHELARLEDLRARGLANGVRGLTEIDAGRIKELEPHATGIRALHSPYTGVIDFRRVALALAEEVRARGGDILTGHRVERLRAVGGWRLVVTSRGTVQARNIISCAGLHSDRVVAMSDGDQGGLRIVPFRGSYLTLRPEARHLVRGLIYPVPDPALPFLGVHFTPRIDGDVWIGPNAIPAFAREGYRLRTVSGRDVFGMAAFPGFWRMAGRHIGEGWAEIRRASRRASLVRELRSYVPDVRRDDLAPGPSGVRAQAVDRRGKLVDDFSFADSPGVIHVRNAPSPGATASLAIGSYIAERAGWRFGLSRSK